MELPESSSLSKENNFPRIDAGRSFLINDLIVFFVKT